MLGISGEFLAIFEQVVAGCDLIVYPHDLERPGQGFDMLSKIDEIGFLATNETEVDIVLVVKYRASATEPPYDLNPVGLAVGDIYLLPRVLMLSNDHGILIDIE